ncbi:MAG: TolC family protein [bacterium]|nr:TolC family protein [bacterium]
MNITYWKGHCAGGIIGTVYLASTACAALSLSPSATIDSLLPGEVLEPISNLVAKLDAHITTWKVPESNIYLTLNECLAMALEYNLGLTIDRYNPPSAAEGVRFAWSAFDPQYSMNFQWNGSLSPRPFQKTYANGATEDKIGNTRSDTLDFGGQVAGKFMTGMQYTFGMGQNQTRVNPGGGMFNPSANSYNQATISVPILNGFGLGVNMAPIRIARNSWRAAQVQLEAAVQDIILTVTRAYWVLYYFREEAAAQQYTLELAYELLKVNEAKVKVGMLAPLDVTKAQAQIATDEEQLLVSLNAVRDAEDALRLLINLKMDDLMLPRALRTVQHRLIPLEKPDVFDIPSDEPYFIQLALQNQQVIEIAQLSLKNTRETLKVAKNNLLPTVNLLGGLGLDGTGGDYGHAYDDQYSGRHPNWTLGVEFSMPILYLEPVATFRQARYAERQAELGVEQAQQNVAIGVRIALRGVETNRKRIDATREATRLSREQLSAEEEKFKVGQSTTFDVLYYQQQLATSLRNEIRALSDWRVSVTVLQRSTGRIIVDNNIIIEDYYEPPPLGAPTLADRIWQ